MMRTILLAWASTLILFQEVRASCKDNKDCASCTKDASWTGQSCRWCTVTKSCHSFGSLDNKCSFSQSLTVPEHCTFKKESYSPDTAYKMTMLSAVAYSNDAKQYISKALPASHFRGIFQVIADCEGEAKCSGFTAVSHVDEMVVIAFRGFEKEQQVFAKFLKSLTGASEPVPQGGKVQKYFKQAFDVIWSILKPKAYELIREYPAYRVFVTGHSLGGALAALASSSVVHDNLTSRTRVVLYTFGEPRLGDHDYAMKHDALVSSSWRVVHHRDVVSHLPPCFQPLGFCVSAYRWPYHHGVEVFYSKRGMNLTSEYKECHGSPQNEDTSCSGWIGLWASCSLHLSQCLEDHMFYFGVRVAFWWRSV